MKRLLKRLMKHPPDNECARCRRHAPPALPIALVAALACLASPPAASTLYAMRTVEEVATQASLVVEATIVTKESRWMAGGRKIATFFSATIRTTLAGTPLDIERAEVVRFAIPGGEVGDFGQRVAGAPTLHPGDRVVLFLSDAVGPQRERRIIGLNLGVFVREAIAEPTLERTSRFIRNDAISLGGDDVGALTIEQLQTRALVGRTR